jgi:hypothetical protein
VLALLFLLVRPEGLFGESTSTASEGRAARRDGIDSKKDKDTMLYREAGQFKATYAKTSRSSRSARIDRHGSSMLVFFFVASRCWPTSTG